MKPEIKAYLDCLENEESARLSTLEAYKNAQKVDLPKNLRPAKASDIVVGAVIWYPGIRYQPADQNEHPVAGWHIVAEVYNPNDEFKGYCSDDGCRYGLYGAFVED